MEKVCSKCRMSKDVEMFSNMKKSKDGKHYICRKCDGERRKKQYYENREHHISKVKKYYNKNKDYYKVQSAIYRGDNKEKLNEYDRFRYKNTLRGVIQVFQKRINRCIEPEKHKIIGKKCREKYIDKYRAKGREWYRNNSDKAKIYQTNYRKENRDKCNRWYVEYKSRKIKQIPPWSIPELCEIFYWMSSQFTKLFSIQYSVDHIIPLHFGGPHSQENLRIMPKNENSSKMDKVDEHLFNFVVSYYNY